MIDFGYELVKGIFENVWNANFFKWGMHSIKALAITFFLLNLFSNMIATKWDWGEQNLPFDKGKFINAFVMVLLVLSYNTIIDSLDSLLGELDKVVNKYSHINHVFDKKLEEKGIIEPDIIDKAKQLAIEAYERVTNPMSILNDILFQVFWIVDNLIYGLFLVERFFAITLLKISAPVVFVLSVHERFRDLFIKWIKLYVAYYFLIVAFLLVIFIGNEIYATIRIKAEQSFIPDVVANNLINVGLLIAVVIKYRLFKKANDMVYKIFTN
ncbi:hypothetical protein ACILDU_11205 [Capnocytophaga canimorsus]|uniref:hypothetical protein n=1 Tax=Capnocytophaga canimorsus TaxID=28188 RepID=UPI0037CF3748